MAYFWEKVRHVRDSLRVSVLIVFAVFGLAATSLGAFVLPLNTVFSDTPAFFMYPRTALNDTSPRFKAAFFYGTVGDPTGTIGDTLVINDSLIVNNVDDTRSVTISLAGKIQNKEGWFVFSENPVVLAPGQSKRIDFIINIPYGVCSKLWEAYIIGSLSAYDGMPIGSGMGVSASSAVEVFFNVAGTIGCSGGEALPNLGTIPPIYVPLPTFKGTIPVMSTGGGGGGGPPPVPVETECSDGVDNDGDGLIDCADPDCASRGHCMILPEICNDGLDNDKNGLIDCADPVCFENSYCENLPEEEEPEVEEPEVEEPEVEEPEVEEPVVEEPEVEEPEVEVFAEICDNLIDDDLDGLIDCADSDCAEFPACLPSMFYITAYPEKRVEKSGGNYSTRALVNFYGLGGKNYSLNVPMSGSGYAQVENTEIEEGWYSVSFKGLSHLTKYLKNSDLSKKSVQVVKNGDNVLDFRLFEPLFLLAGDTALGKDDFINSMDISSSTKVLYQNEEHGDLNKDGAVNALDLSILFFNLYKAGEK